MFVTHVLLISGQCACEWVYVMEQEAQVCLWHVRCFSGQCACEWVFVMELISAEDVHLRVCLWHLRCLFRIYLRAACNVFSVRVYVLVLCMGYWVSLRVYVWRTKRHWARCSSNPQKVKMLFSCLCIFYSECMHFLFWMYAFSILNVCIFYSECMHFLFWMTVCVNVCVCSFESFLTGIEFGLDFIHALSRPCTPSPHTLTRGSSAYAFGIECV